MTTGKYCDPDWIGKKFNMLTVIEPVHVQNGMGKSWYWKVRCDCGNEKVVRPIRVMKGRTKSCGCYLKTMESPCKTHGESHTRLHNIWMGMIGRCNPDSVNAERYGKRGIKVCEEWKDYITFSTWAREHGYADNLTIERIDVNGNYCPENCKWIEPGKQARNRRTTHYVTYNGREMSLAEACEIAGLPYKQVFERIVKRKWPVEDALSIPMGEGGRRTETKVQKCQCCGKEYTAVTVNRKYCSDACRKEVKNAKRRKGNFLRKNST